MQKAFFHMPLYRKFSSVDAFARLPDKSAMLPFRQ